ncbi:uncharacterized protein LOC117580062 [Drosophila guanche]|uniref:uncharacterized protein LOC117580062 n=1 Tax=Drosophila guanche TaxID=7266 RepID=UPI001471B409|nr:uncharacterized protein LOC117580062 [Drosophila guanche]
MYQMRGRLTLRHILPERVWPMRVCQHYEKVSYPASPGHLWLFTVYSVAYASYKRTPWICRARQQSLRNVVVSGSSTVHKWPMESECPVKTTFFSQKIEEGKYDRLRTLGCDQDYKFYIEVAHFQSESDSTSD